MSKISDDYRISTIRDGMNCRIKRYIYGPETVNISHYDDGKIICGVVGKRSGELIGYIVGRRDLIDGYIEEYVSKGDI